MSTPLRSKPHNSPNQQDLLPNLQHQSLRASPPLRKLLAARTNNTLDLLLREFLDPDLFIREARADLVAVVRRDPDPCAQLLHDLQSAGEAGTDVAAHVPCVLHAVEAVQERGEWERGFGDQVRGDVGRERLVGAAVGGEDDGQRAVGDGVGEGGFEGAGRGGRGAGEAVEGVVGCGRAVGDADGVVEAGDVWLLRDEGDSHFAGGATGCDCWEGDSIDG